MRIGSKIVHLISSLYVLLALTACVEEELRQPMLGKGEGYLTLQVGPISAEVQAAPLTKATTTLEAEEIPAVTALTINVTSGGTQVSGFPKPYAKLSAPIVLPTGTYTIEAYYGENKTLDTKPYFYDSQEFTINALQSTSVELAPSLGNAMLKPIVDADLQKHYSKWTLSVTVGSITETLASNESQRNLYVHKEEAVAVSFTGTNLIGGETSKEATVTNSAAAGTQYVIQCNPKNLPSFDLRTQATAEHTKVGELLSGTKVMINVASLTGTPAALITGWKAELQNQAGTIVRTFTGSGAPTQNSPAEMTQAGDWPYLPQGTYTLRSSLTLKTGELTAENVSTVEVPAPTFTVSASAYTSYNKYLAGEIDAANSCDGSTIYGMEAAPSITDALQNNPNYTQSSALTLDGNAVSAGNAESQSWAAHTLNASYTFDGVTMNGSETYHVTGLPFISNPPTTTFWKKKEGDVTWEKNLVRLGKVAWSNPQIIESETLHVPENKNINILLSTNYKVHGATVGTTFTLSLGEDVLFTTTVKDWYKNKTVTDTKQTVITPSKKQIVCKNSYGLSQTYSELHYLNLTYR